MRETWVWPLGWGDLLEKGMATHSSILVWRIPWTVIIHGVAKSQTRLSNFHFHMNFQGTQFSSWQKYISGSIVLFQIHQRKKVKLLSCVRLCDPMDCSLPCTIHGIFRQEYWSGLPFPPPEDLTNPGTEPGFLAL